MANCINTTMKAVEAAGRNAVSAGVVAKTHVLELLNGDDPVLLRGDPRDHCIRSAIGAFSPHVGR